MGSGRSSKLQLAATTPPRKSHQVQLAPGPPSGGILTSPPALHRQSRAGCLQFRAVAAPPNRWRRGPRAWRGAAGSCPQPSTSRAPSAPGTASTRCSAHGAQHVALVGLAAVLRHSRATDPIACRPGGEGAPQQLRCSDGHVPPTPQCPGGGRARECLEGGQVAD